MCCLESCWGELLALCTARWVMPCLQAEWGTVLLEGCVAARTAPFLYIEPGDVIK